MKFQNEKFQFTVERQVDGKYALYYERLRDLKVLGLLLRKAKVKSQMCTLVFDSFRDENVLETSFSINQVLGLLAVKNAKPLKVDLTPEEIKNKLENLNVKKFSEINDY